MKKLFVESISYNEFNNRHLYREVEINKIKKLLEDDKNIKVKLDDKVIYDYDSFMIKFKDLLPQSKRKIDHKVTARVSYDTLQRFKYALKQDGDKKAQDVVLQFILSYIDDVESRFI